jgi:predicted dehydrogenase
MGVTKKRVLLVGAGGFGGVWARSFLPTFADRVEVAGLVDIKPEVLARAGDALGLPESARFTDMEEGFARTEADVCVLVIQPHLRWRAVNLAVERGMAVLAEKPIAESWETALAILRLARESGVKLSVVQNYRYSRRIRTLKSVLESGRLGRINTIQARFAADYTIDTAGGAFRHQVPYAMLYEGAVHHFDQFRNLAGADGAWIAGHQWNPAWSTFANPTTALFLLTMTNGIACQFEMNHVARGRQNGWHHEGYVIECEHGDVTLDGSDTVRIEEHLGGDRLRVTEVEPVTAPFEDHYWIIDEYLNWLDGGPVPVTNAEDNIHTAALSFAAVEAVRTGASVDIAAMTAAGLSRLESVAAIPGIETPG